jgi:hypothetical protein
MDDQALDKYRAMIREGLEAGIPVAKASIQADDFFPEKSWDVLAISGYMGPDPYSGAPGVEKINDDTYRLTVRMASPQGDKRITFDLRLMESLDHNKLVFNPLLNRFMSGEDYETRPVKISDSGRIRNELQTLCSEALEFIGNDRIRVHFKSIHPEVIATKSQAKLWDILKWYKANHPIWFSWLELVDDT